MFLSMNYVHYIDRGISGTVYIDEKARNDR